MWLKCWISLEKILTDFTHPVPVLLPNKQKQIEKKHQIYWGNHQAIKTCQLINTVSGFSADSSQPAGSEPEHSQGHSHVTEFQ